MKALKIPEMLLERLKKEFDRNYKIAVKTSNSPDVAAVKHGANRSFQYILTLKNLYQ